MTQVNATDLRSTSWAIGQPYDGMEAASTYLSFAIPSSRWQHSFLLTLDNGDTYPITLGEQAGGQPANGGNQPQLYGFFNAYAYPAESWQSAWLIDMTAWEHGPANLTDLTAAAWATNDIPLVQHSVTIIMSPDEANYSFTFHTSNQTLQGIYPYWSGYTDPNSGQWVSAYIISGIAGNGANYWITRDGDGAISPQPQMQFTDQTVDWSGVFAPLRYYQTATFQIGAVRASHTLSVHEQDGLVNYLYPVESGDTLVTWDDNGQPVTYYYSMCQAALEYDSSSFQPLPWTLFDETTGESLGQVFTLLEGWQPWHPNPPGGYLSIDINQSRHSHTLNLVQDDGTTWNVSPAAGYESDDASLSAWNIYFGGKSDQRTLEIRYFPANAPYDPSQGLPSWTPPPVRPAISPLPRQAPT